MIKNNKQNTVAKYFPIRNKFLGTSKIFNFLTQSGAKPSLKNEVIKFQYGNYIVIAPAKISTYNNNNKIAVIKTDHTLK